MTLGKLLQRVKQLFNTTYTDDLLAEWAAEMDGRVLREDYLRKEFEVSYDPAQDENTQLLLQEPWTQMYDAWLLQKVHFMRGEYDDAANFASMWEAQHHDWLRNLLSTTPTDAFGRPWLTDVAFVRRGSDGVVHMTTIFETKDLAGVQAYVVQKNEAKISMQMGDERMLVADDWISIMLRGEDTALLEKGSANIVIVAETVAGERYESDKVQIRVLESGLEGVRV